MLASCRTGYTRVIVEKPFGKDSESFRQLSADLYQHLTEDQMYRIDHYLGKELIENLTVRLSLSDPFTSLLSLFSPAVHDSRVHAFLTDNG